MELSMNLVKRKDVAKFFGVTTMTIIRWEKSGLISPVKINKLVYYRIEDIKKLSKEGD
jgi:DNA-binding transcriptional MerR regulator